jgi:hypothetical protein
VVLSSPGLGRTIVFCNKKHVASWVANALEQKFGIRCAQIHGMGGAGGYGRGGAGVYKLRNPPVVDLWRLKVVQVA